MPSESPESSRNIGEARMDYQYGEIQIDTTANLTFWEGKKEFLLSAVDCQQNKHPHGASMGVNITHG